MRVGLGVIAVGLLIVASTLVWNLSTSEPRSAGTNSINTTSNIKLESSETLCQGGEALPKEASSVRIGVSPNKDHSRELLVSGWTEDGVRWKAKRTKIIDRRFITLEIPSHARHQSIGFCLTNTHPRSLSVVGQAGPPNWSARIGKRPAPGRAALTWLRDGEESGWNVAPVVANRATIGRTDWGTWTPLVLLTAVWISALGLLIARVR